VVVDAVYNYLLTYLLTYLIKSKTMHSFICQQANNYWHYRLNILLTVNWRLKINYRNLHITLQTCSLHMWLHHSLHVPLSTKQYKLVPAMAGKVTVGLASHRPCVTDSVVYPPTDMIVDLWWIDHPPVV